jgi:ribonuclease VapC
MLVVDTSALMAIVLGEPTAEACIAAMTARSELAMSAGSLAEAFVVAERRGCRRAMERLIHGLGLEIVAVTPSDAVHVADAYRQWGKGAHIAGLNFGDCFAYALAKARNAALLYVGDDFSKTDIVSAIER